MKKNKKKKQKKKVSKLIKRLTSTIYVIPNESIDNHIIPEQISKPSVDTDFSPKSIINTNLIQSFSDIEKNETGTDKTAIEPRYIRRYNGFSASKEIHYISDLHIMHALQNAKCQSKNDINHVIQNIINSILQYLQFLDGPIFNGTLIIAGDITSDFDIFTLFIEILSETIYEKTCQHPENVKVIFILGNHELWSFPNKTLPYIINQYRTLLEKHGMYLLHNELLYIVDISTRSQTYEDVNIIPYETLCNTPIKELSEQLAPAQMIMLGGTGFSGYNHMFNANNGIYRTTINREQEIEETRKFEELYKKLRPILEDKNSIVLTHMPIECWSEKPEYYQKVIYVNGHTHRNEFYDDGIKRIYADNQSGYHCKRYRLKYFYIDRSYDSFEDHPDGIYEVTNEQYINFYRGKNKHIELSQQFKTLYMLKKNGYYCFICVKECKDGYHFYIMNGGGKKRIWETDIDYYYENMDRVINIINKPLEKYTQLQEIIANEIKAIGGLGSIHGCIIDIDFYNHIFLNPDDLKITPYHAMNRTDKTVYPDVIQLLMDKKPVLYHRLTQMSSKKLPIISKKSNGITKSQKYTETDIYQKSFQIGKLQKLKNGILTNWIELKDIEIEEQKQLLELRD